MSFFATKYLHTDAQMAGKKPGINQHGTVTRVVHGVSELQNK